MKRNRNIIRVDHDASQTHAWRVTLQRRRKIMIKTFSDNVFGGKRKALAAALSHRDRLLDEVELVHHQLWLRTILRCNNTSGIAGVGRYDQRANPRSGRRRVFWLAYWGDENGVRRQRRFSVSRYGERKAKQRDRRA